MHRIYFGNFYNEVGACRQNYSTKNKVNNDLQIPSRTSIF